MPLPQSENERNPSVPHAASPPTQDASVILVLSPPLSLRLTSDRSLMYATHCASGESTGAHAPSVPGKGVALSLLSSRTQSLDAPLSSVSVKTRRLPSRASAM